MNRKKLILAVLLLILAGAVVSSFFRMPKQERAAQLKYKPAPVATQPKPGAKSATPPKAAGSAKVVAPTTAGSAPEGKLRLDLLERHEAFTGFRRNIFKPLFASEQPKPAAPVKAAPQPVPSLIPAPPAPKVSGPGSGPAIPAQPPLPPPLPRPQVDLARFTFVGFLQKDNQKTIFLSKDKEIFVVKKGDKLAGKYEAANITDEALTIRVLQSGGEIIIPLIENKALVPVGK